ncbi:MAG: RNA polymerase sigma factor, partial [Lentisphaeria bacterium]
MIDDKGLWLEGLMIEYEQALLRYALGFCRNIEQARDVVQDTFIKLYAMDRGRFSNGEKAWLYKVCRNRCFEILRKERRVVAMGESFLEREDKRDNPAKSYERTDSVAH